MDCALVSQFPRVPEPGSYYRAAGAKCPNQGAAHCLFDVHIRQHAYRCLSKHLGKFSVRHVSLDELNPVRYLELFGQPS